MNKPHTRGVKTQSVCRFHRLFGGIQVVAEDGMTNRGEVHTQLMRATSSWRELNTRNRTPGVCSCAGDLFVKVAKSSAAGHFPVGLAGPAQFMVDNVSRCVFQILAKW